MKRLIQAVTFLMGFLMLIMASPVYAESADTSSITEIKVGVPIEEHPELFLPRSMPTHGDGRIAVFLIEFPDHKNDDPNATREFFNNIYFGSGSEVYWDGEKPLSVADFYKEQSYGKLNLSGRVFDWYTAKHERSYYDNCKEALITEAAEYYTAQGIDFSEFDGNDDGIIDAITFHFAGAYSGSSDDPWYSGTEYERGGNAFGEIGGIRFITMVQIAANFKEERMLTGIICHELGHTLGLDDLYGNITGNYGHFTHDLMSHNARTINPYSKLMLGWLDTVSVITGGASNVRLERYKTFSADSVAIVCNKFNGFFDEFYMIAYREFYNSARTAAIWHVDARLNANGTSFRYNNLNYDPTPDIQNPHDDGGNYSTYAFIEELSGDPDLNYLFFGGPSAKETSFLNGGVIGPNTIPSSDTHDGEYTGIQIENFTLHNLPEDKKDGTVPKDESYVTFDVAFLKDNTPPTVLTNESELVFQEKITVLLSESVYIGEDWSGIKVTDLDGNKLDATVKLSYHLRHQLEISFNSEAYKQGYQIILPESCLRDSSGNGLRPAILTAKPVAHLFPLEETQLESAGFTRNNANAHFFTTTQGFDVLTFLWAYSPALQTNVPSAKLELMSFDHCGNVIGQFIVDNPIANSDIERIARTKDGYYLVFCSPSDDMNLGVNSVFCIDSKGNLKWKNESFVGTKITFVCDIYTSLSTEMSVLDVEGGVVVKIMDESTPSNVHSLMFIDIKTGEISSFDHPLDKDRIHAYHFYNIGNGKVLCVDRTLIIIGEKQYNSVYILDSNTLEIITENRIERSYYISDVHTNADGTFLVYGEKNRKSFMLCLDAALNIVNEISWERDTKYNEYIHWLDNDGFFLVNILSSSSHADTQYHARYYNKCLDPMWETDICANFFRFFRTPDGDMICYRSRWSPRECYIDFYGSDKEFHPAHTHTVAHYEKTAGSCTVSGHAEFWQCTDCGVMFSDEGKTVILDGSGLFTLFKGHSYDEWKITTTPTCQTDGEEKRSCTVCGETFTQAIPASDDWHVSGGTNAQGSCKEDVLVILNCSICQKELRRQLIPASGSYHKRGEWSTVSKVSCVENGLKVVECTVCQKELNRQTEPASDKYHVSGKWVTVNKASCIEDGLKTVSCTICKKELNKQTEPASDKYHVYGKWTTVTEPSCRKDGLSVRKCTVCDEETDTQSNPASDKYHVAGEWSVTKAPTESDFGVESQLCRNCGAAMNTRSIEKLSPSDEKQDDSTANSSNSPTNSYALFIGIGAVGIVILAAACFVYALKKKKQ